MFISPTGCMPVSGPMMGTGSVCSSGGTSLYSLYSRYIHYDMCVAFFIVLFMQKVIFNNNDGVVDWFLEKKTIIIASVFWKMRRKQWIYGK